MKSYSYVEMYKEKKGLGSDYKASIELGISRAAMSNYKNGRPLDEDLALQIAEVLGIEPAEILYTIAAEKSRRPEARRKWAMLSKLSKESGRATANLLFLLPFPAFGVLHYILC